MNELKIFGAFRTGSNLVRALLEMNYHAVVHNNNAAYKHIPVPANFRDNQYTPFPINIVATVKDPFAFIDSTFRYCKKNNYLNIEAGDTFEEFCIQPFTVFDGGFENFPRYRFANPVQYWNSLYANLCSIPDERIAIIRYEDLLIDMQGTVELVAEKYKLEKKSESFLAPQGITINLGDPPRKEVSDYFSSNPFERNDYYLERQYLERFTQPQIDFVYSELDTQLLDIFKYGRHESPFSSAKRKALFFHKLVSAEKENEQQIILQNSLLSAQNELSQSQERCIQLVTEARSMDEQLLSSKRELQAQLDLRKTAEAEAQRKAIEAAEEIQKTEEESQQKALQAEMKIQNAEAEIAELNSKLTQSLQMQQTVQLQLDEKALSLESHQRYAAALRADLDIAKKNYRAVIDSVSYKFGYDLIHAVIKPGKNTALLPLRLIKHLSSGSKQTPEVIKPTLREQEQIAPSRDDENTSLSRTAKELNVACIFDQFTIEGYTHECNLIPVPLQGWEEIFSQTRPDIFFVESAWRGNSGAWEYKVGTYAGEDRSELASIIQWCNDNQVPTVFWNKEDPVNYDKFIDAARRFDIIFTTDIEMVPKYQEASGHNHVYPLIFSAQPELHNPIRSYVRENKACFAGTYYRNVYEERKKDMDEVLDIAQEYGLAIYDRNYERNQSGENEFTFPERFQQDILGTLDYSEMDRAYKGYRFTLNVNSIKRSPSMFSRRVFESLACGTPVLSTPSLGVEKVFGDLVIMTGDNIDPNKVLDLLQCDDHEYQKRSLGGIREIFSKHLYQHRFAEILMRCGIEVATTPDPEVTMVAIVENGRQAKNVVSCFGRQAYAGKKLILFIDQAKGVEQQINELQSENIIPLHLYSAEVLNYTLADLVDTEFVSIIKPENYYGPYFLTDLVQASMYADADIYGKQAQFEASNKELKLSGGEDYQFVDEPISPISGIITTAQVGNLEITELRTMILQEQLSELFNRSDLRAFSVNRWNFIANAYLAGAELGTEDLEYVSL